MTTISRSPRALLKHRSRDITEGAERAPARAMLMAMGLTADDLEKPFVAVANLASDVTPCNVHLDRFAAAVKEGIRSRQWYAVPVWHHHRQRRHLHGNRGDEGFPGESGGDR